MKLNFVKVNPVENMTIFVMDQVDSSHHMAVANRLMDYSNIHGEQVGFIENPRSLKAKSLNTLRLQMMGGEFCGNATRSLAALMVHLKLPSISKVDNIYNVTLEVSGCNELLNCEVRTTDKENTYLSRVKMPLPQRISNSSLNFEDKRINITRVDFVGITHYIVDGNEIENRDEFYNYIKRNMYKEEYDAFGIMFYDSDKNYLTPLVYVKATDSRYWERSCATGTAALGVSLASSKNSNLHEKIKQPGGELEVRVILDNGKISELFLDGKVEIIAEGIVYIDDQL